jgi:uncharacterized protein (DUF1501 family)
MSMPNQTMQRRTFLTAAGASLLGMSLSLRPSPAAAQGDAYEGPFWIFVNASGGWDPQFLFNPTDRVEHNRFYTALGKVGNIPYAGWEVDPAQLGFDAAFDPTGILYSPRAFLERYGNRMTVINGIDTTTNNHDSGVRVMASGKLTEGYPALGALVASAGGGRTMPLAFLAGGGYDATMGLVPAVRVNNVDVIRRIAEPNLISPDAAAPVGYHTQNTWDRIRKRQLERLERLADAQQLPTIQRAMKGLAGARLSDGGLSKLVLPEQVRVGNGLGGLETAMRQAQLAVAAFKNGLAISASMRIGGFDTHGTHDRNQPRNLAQLLGAVAFVLDEVDRNELANKVYVIVTSEFGRGPHYNGTDAGSGKDHWPITSLLAFGPTIPGDRAVGETDSDQRALAVDPGTLAVTKGGVIIGPEHVHSALRKIGGITDGEVARAFPLPAAQELALFG